MENTRWSKNKRLKRKIFAEMFPYRITYLLSHHTNQTKLINPRIQDIRVIYTWIDIVGHLTFCCCCFFQTKISSLLSLWSCRHAARGWMHLRGTKWKEILPLHALQPDFRHPHDHQACPELWPHFLLLCKWLHDRHLESCFNLWHLVQQRESFLKLKIFMR